MSNRTGDLQEHDECKTLLRASSEEGDVVPEWSSVRSCGSLDEEGDSRKDLPEGMVVKAQHEITMEDHSDDNGNQICLHKRASSFLSSASCCSSASSSSLLVNSVSSQEPLWMYPSDKGKIPPHDDDNSCICPSPSVRSAVFQGGVGFWFQQQHEAHAADFPEDPPGLVDLRQDSQMSSFYSSNSDWTFHSDWTLPDEEGRNAHDVPAPFVDPYIIEELPSFSDPPKASHQSRLSYTSIDEEILRVLFPKGQVALLSHLESPWKGGMSCKTKNADLPEQELFAQSDREDGDIEAATISEHRMALARTATNVIQELDSIFVFQFSSARP